MTIGFTICSNNYLAQAITLGESLLANNPGYSFRIGLVDKKNSTIDYKSIPFEIIEVEKLNIEGWDRMILRYNIQEINTAVKPFYFNYLINLPEHNKSIIYLDPDILVYNHFSELEKELEENDIIITPHITFPIWDNKFPNENDFLNVGLYNLGFIAIKKSSNSINMINWWSERLKDRGYNDVKNGMFTDQLWINFLPLFFERVKIFRHPGYNMAYWNLHERLLYEKDSQYLVNEDLPLVFFHFSGYFPTKPGEISKYQNRYTFEVKKALLPLFLEYGALLERNKYSYFSTFKCHYIGIKEHYDEKMVLARIRQIPIYKRYARKMINYITKKFNIILDYRVFYEREYLEKLY